MDSFAPTTVTMLTLVEEPAHQYHPFTDVRNNMISVEWSMTMEVDPWRFCDRFSVEGVCRDPFCRAVGKRVHCNPFQMRKEKSFSWRLGSKLIKITCPCCGSEVVPINVGFHNCFFRVSGRTVSGQTVDHLWVEAGNAYTTWDEPSSSEFDVGLTKWSYLEFFYREKQQQQQPRF